MACTLRRYGVTDSGQVWRRQRKKEAENQIIDWRFTKGRHYSTDTMSSRNK
ncbi:MAG: hypothetical protein P8X74_09740 [Reinekea sp.]